MTPEDIAATKLCANAMGYVIFGMTSFDGREVVSISVMHKGWRFQDIQPYDPLNKRTQAFDLVETFKLNLGGIGYDRKTGELKEWSVSFPVRNGPTDWTNDPDLKRAIVYCVAAREAKNA